MILVDSSVWIDFLRGRQLPQASRFDALRCTECMGAEGEPECKPVCLADWIVTNAEFQELPEELMAKYEALDG
ncbi:MAG: ferredoxin [Burkholderiales bacterium]|nr:ferredoxin [Burkholderiales bacterium]